MRSEPLPFFQTDQIFPQYLYQASKSQYIYNNFLNHKIRFWKQKNNLCKNYFVLCLYNCIAVLQSCCSCYRRTLSKVSPSLNFFLNVFKRYCALPFKARSLEMYPWYNKEFLCLQFFPFVKQVSKSGKSVCQKWFLCFTLYDLFSAGFFIGIFCLSVRPCRS